MNYAQAIARRNELVRQVRAANRATLEHSPWFTPPPAPVIAAPPPPPETSHYADFLVLRMFVEALLTIKDTDKPLPEVVVNDNHQFLTDRLTIKRIQLTTCEYFRISIIDLLSARRTNNIVRPRMIATYLSKRLTLKSLPEIGGRFNRDHTSSLNAIRKIERLISEGDEDVIRDVDALLQILETPNE